MAKLRKKILNRIPATSKDEPIYARKSSVFSFRTKRAESTTTVDSQLTIQANDEQSRRSSVLTGSTIQPPNYDQSQRQSDKLPESTFGNPSEEDEIINLTQKARAAQARHVFGESTALNALYDLDGTDDAPSLDWDSMNFHGRRPFNGKVGSRSDLVLPDEPQEYNDPHMSEGLKYIASIPCSTWATIVSMLDPSDAANLALSCKLLRFKLGSQPWTALRIPTNKAELIKFLNIMDPHMPDHLLCFPCARFHPRLHPGHERLHPSYVLNPVFDCPNARHAALPRTRIAHGRTLPYYLVQLALRSSRLTPTYGMPLSHLARSWHCRDSAWQHRTRFHIHAGHLLMRCYSSVFAAPDLTASEQRLLLFSRSDYAPYFSVCAHWTNYALLTLVKCALTHVPRRAQGYVDQMLERPRLPSRKVAKPDLLPRLCEACKPMRRCPFCPTEYLVELKVVEDKRDAVHRFKHALCVTRWSDLGDGLSPSGREWRACNGEGKFDSVGVVGNASLASHFEAAVSMGAPNQNLLLLGNYGEDGY